MMWTSGYSHPPQRADVLADFYPMVAHGVVLEGKVAHSGWFSPWSCEKY